MNRSIGKNKDFTKAAVYFFQGNNLVAGALGTTRGHLYTVVVLVVGELVSVRVHVCLSQRQREILSKLNQTLEK